MKKADMVMMVGAFIGALLALALILQSGEKQRKPVGLDLQQAMESGGLTIIATGSSTLQK